MAVKGWFRRLQPMQLYLVLILTSAFFFVELATSHIAHALTLLVNAYHMLCNIIALVGCIASIKYSDQKVYDNENRSDSKLESSGIRVSGDEKCGSEPSLSARLKRQSQSDRRMKNTFGWARINILTMLVCCVFLGSFCFSIQVEAVQTLLHVNHTVTGDTDYAYVNDSDNVNDNDTEMRGMDHPLAVLYIGIAGIFLNVFSYLLIGGYTFHHGSSIRVANNGRVVMERDVAPRGTDASLPHRGRQGLREMCRDILGCVFVIVVSLLVRYSDPSVGKFIDPVIAMVSSISLFVLSYPYMKESGLILLQTIPNHININSLQKELLEAFPGIVNVHDLHVWQLTGENTIATAHIMFLDPTVYANIAHRVTGFFVEMGITQVTIQPEFHKIKPRLEKANCLIRCQVENCVQSRCCSNVSLDSECEKKTNSQLSQTINKKFDKKEIIPSSPPIDLKRYAQRDTDTESSRDPSPEKTTSVIQRIAESNAIACETVRGDDTTTATATATATTDEANSLAAAQLHRALVRQNVEENYDKETV